MNKRRVAVKLHRLVRPSADPPTFADKLPSGSDLLQFNRISGETVDSIIISAGELNCVRAVACRYITDALEAVFVSEAVYLVLVVRRKVKLLVDGALRQLTKPVWI